MTSRPKAELIRIGILKTDDDNKASNTIVTIDSEGMLEGRGAYLCKSRQCFEAAKKRRAINRTLKREVTPEAYERIGEYFEQF